LVYVPFWFCAQLSTKKPKNKSYPEQEEKPQVLLIMNGQSKFPGRAKKWPTNIIALCFLFLASDEEVFAFSRKSDSKKTLSNKEIKKWLIKNWTGLIINRVLRIFL